MKKRRQPLSRLASAKLLIDAYEDLSASEIRKLPKSERQLYVAAQNFLDSLEHAKQTKKPKRKPVKVRRITTSKRPKQPRAVKPKTQTSKRPKSKAKKYDILNDFPELDYMDEIEDLLDAEMDTEWYSKENE